MPVKHLQFGKEFSVALGNARSQAATMVVQPGKSVGGPQNYHRGADQWLYVVAGTGVALIDGKRYDLRRGSLLLIEKGQRHEIRNLGRRPLKTVNFYVPPAYTKEGDTRPPGKPGE